MIEENGTCHRFRYLNSVPLNDANFDLEVNFLEYKPNGKVAHFSWVTDFRIDPAHLFGHGDQNLTTVLMHLMMVAFLIDQIQQRCCRLFQGAVTAALGKSRFWNLLRSFFTICLIPDWETLYRSVIQETAIPLACDTS